MVLVNRPPTEHGIEIETAEGAIFRLDADQLKAQDIPSGLSFSTQRGDGFATCTFTLNREIFKDWADLNLLDTVRVIARDGSIDWEGLIQSFPRTNDPQQIITVNCVGFMTTLKWRPMTALIIDRRLASWSLTPSTARLAKLYESGWSANAASATTAAGDAAGPSISITATGKLTKPWGEIFFYAGGEGVGKLIIGTGGTLINLLPHGSDVKTNLVPFSSFDIDHTTGSLGPDFSATAATEFAPEGAPVGVGVYWNYEASSVGAEGTSYGVRLVNPHVIGTHGLTARGTSPEEGYYVSDVIRYVLERFGSKLFWEGEENQFLLTQCTWHDNPQTPYDGIQQLNNYVLWETNVWEDRKFHFEPADLTQADWQIRTSDPGVTVQFQGDSIESFANGVVITYSDFFDHTYTLYPDDHEELRDENENNAASRHGEDIWINYTIPDKCLEAEALQFGRAYLTQNNRPKRPGSFTVVGHIEDSAGHWHRASEVRNSQTLAVVDDLYEGEPRLITATTYDEESAVLTITVDAPPMTMEAIVARNTLALEAKGLNG